MHWPEVHWNSSPLQMAADDGRERDIVKEEQLVEGKRE
jgi:hypothetical protein